MYNLLEHWSLKAWTELNARSDKVARAFSSGMSLAETFWFMHRPSPSAPEPESSREDWRELLSYYRLEVERRRIESVQAHLPPYVGETIRHNLREWSIGSELERDEEGELRRIHFIFRRSHPLGILSWRINEGRWRKSPLYFKLLHPLGFFERFRRPAKSPKANPEELKAIYETLGAQMRRWSGIIFGIREPTSYLNCSDRRIITWTRRCGLFAASLGIVLPMGVAVYLVILLASLFIPVLKVGTFSDLVSMLSVLATLVSVLALAFKALFTWSREVQQRLHRNLTAYFIARRVLVPWDRKLKRIYRKRRAQEGAYGRHKRGNLRHQVPQPRDDGGGAAGVERRGDEAVR